MLVKLCDCSSPDHFAYLSLDDDTAQHHIRSIIHEIFSHTCPLMANYVDNDSGCAFQLCIKIWRCLKKNTGNAVCEASLHLLLVFSFIRKLMVNCLLAVIGLFPSPTEQSGVPLVTVAMTTAGTATTGVQFAFHGIDWPHCSIYTDWGIERVLGTQQYKHGKKVGFAFVKCSGMRCEWHL